MDDDDLRPLILVPGYWLGGWAWDEVSAQLSARGARAQAVTLPGLESASAPRRAVRLVDHVAAVVAAIRSGDGPVVLVAHSGAGMLATSALNEVPELVHRVVYVESGPVADGAVARLDLAPGAVDLPLPPLAELDAGGASLAGLTEEALRRFEERAAPHPAGPLREPVRLRNPARNDIAATVVCCSFPAAAVQDMARSGDGMFAPLADLSDVRYVDLPTGHWPMWSEPQALGDLLAEAARD